MAGILVSVLILLSPAERDSILTEHPANAAFWQEMFQQQLGDTLNCIEYLFLVIPDEDRDSMTEAVLNDHVLGAIGSRGAWFQTLQDSIFLDYLLEYRISSEPLSSYRSSLAGWLERHIQIKATPYETAEQIYDVVTGNIVLVASSGPEMAPTQIIPVGQASREGRWVLLCACMRSMGIPVRPVKGWFPGADMNLYRWMDIWTGDSWEPLSRGIPPVQYVKVAFECPSLDNITGEYRNTGTLALNPITDPGAGWTAELMIPSGDDTVSITGISIDPFQRSILELGAGEFLLRVQFVQNGELIGSWLQNVTVISDSTVAVDLTEAQYTIVPLPR
ncbi:MAG: transglutaminase domain-containing protein [Candidatus Fermentibacteraceae bacterium]|nr:transglutaminase domain-containing protein [Candidatus Fermentibacteraceae bacterium]MBN2607915.1 transglutaminase domain-containing protein [Candidatus Fermentibacteraceae bacterium]